MGLLGLVTMYLHSNRGLHKSITHVMYLWLSSESLSLLEIVDHKQYTSHLFDNAYQVELISTPGITADTSLQSIQLYYKYQVSVRHLDLQLLHVAL